MDGFVGDPFITSGLLAVKLKTGFSIAECSEDKLKQISDELVYLYLTPAWSKELQSIFPNSTYNILCVNDWQSGYENRNHQLP
jgi:CRISPR-associated protein Cst1